MKKAPGKECCIMSARTDWILPDSDDLHATEGGPSPSLFAHIGQFRSVWPAARIASVSFDLLVNIPRQIEIFRLMRTPVFRGLRRLDPKLPFKYLSVRYLTTTFDLATRASCFLHHYRRLKIDIQDSFLRRIMLGNVPLFEMRDGGHSLQVSIGLETTCGQEGELSLNYLVDGEAVFILSFTIVPGWTVGSARPDVLLISRIQGTKGRYRQISLAMKTFHNVAPPAVLLAAAQGVACALGIGEIASVSAAIQICYAPEFVDVLTTAYDDFFAELGIAKNAKGFFLTPVPIEDKPLAVIKKGHKLRTREKREFKRQITDEVTRLLSERPAVSAEPSRADRAVHIAVAVES